MSTLSLISHHLFVAAAGCADDSTEGSSLERGSSGEQPDSAEFIPVEVLSNETVRGDGIAALDR